MRDSSAYGARNVQIVTAGTGMATGSSPPMSGVFSFGDASFYGAAAPEPAVTGVIGLFSINAGSGYTIVSGNGTAVMFE